MWSAISAAVKARHDGSRRDISSRWVGAVVVTVCLVATETARAGCSLVQISTDPGELEGDWQAAVMVLMEQTRRAGTPWSCAGGSLLVRVDDDDHAVLRFRDPRGRDVERHVPSARALVATAEALLAGSSPPETTPPVVDEAERALERPTFEEASARRLSAPSRHEPRFIVAATVGVRFSGPSPALWLAPELHVTLPFDAWSVGVWARAGLPYVFDVVPLNFSMSQVNLGFAAGRVLLSAPIELRVVFTPSLSVVTMDADAVDHEASGAKVDLFLGAGLRGAIPLSPRWRAVLVVDAELAPAGIRAARRFDPVLPVLPTYEVGAALGVELVAR